MFSIFNQISNVKIYLKYKITVEDIKNREQYHFGVV